MGCGSRLIYTEEETWREGFVGRLLEEGWHQPQYGRTWVTKQCGWQPGLPIQRYYQAAGRTISASAAIALAEYAANLTATALWLKTLLKHSVPSKFWAEALFAFEPEKASRCGAVLTVRVVLVMVDPGNCRLLFNQPPLFMPNKILGQNGDQWSTVPFVLVICLAEHLPALNNWWPAAWTSDKDPLRLFTEPPHSHLLSIFYSQLFQVIFTHEPKLIEYAAFATRPCFYSWHEFTAFITLTGFLFSIATD